MRKLISITAFTILFAAAAAGQRGSMGGGPGGIRGGGGRGFGGGPRGGFGGGGRWTGGHWMGGHGGDHRGGGWSGSRPGGNRGAFYGSASIIGSPFFYPGYQSGFYSSGLGYGLGLGAGYGYPYTGYFPSWGLGYSSWPGAYTGSYDATPNVMVVYPPRAEPVATVTNVYTEPVKPVLREYDFTAEPQTESPIYLFAFKDQSIRAAASYRIEAGVLHYTNLDRQEKQASLDTLDRELSLRLNRQRKVALQLPQ